MKKLLVLLLALTLLSLGACNRRAPIYTVQDFPAAQKLSLAEMEQCIMDAGSSNGWQMTKIKPGLIDGLYRIAGGKHVAVVSIPYTQTHYSILYKSSSNLKEKEGTIHGNYNKLVRSLEAAINFNTRNVHAGS